MYIVLIFPLGYWSPDVFRLFQTNQYVINIDIFDDLDQIINLHNQKTGYAKKQILPILICLNVVLFLQIEKQLKN